MPPVFDTVLVHFGVVIVHVGFGMLGRFLVFEMVVLVVHGGRLPLTRMWMSLTRLWMTMAGLWMSLARLGMVVAWRWVAVVTMSCMIRRPRHWAVWMMLRRT